MTIWAITLYTASVSYAGDLLPFDRPVHEAIDYYVDAQLAAAGVTPAPLADETNLLRRTMLDLVGRIPIAREAQEYASSSNSIRREKLLDRLLQSPAYVRHQADEFNSMLMYGVRGNVRDYLLKAFRDRYSWDRMFRDLLVGDQLKPPHLDSVEFVKQRTDDLDKLTNDASTIFFGVNVSCAQCHDHPLVPEWSQQHFYGMKSFFARTFANGNFVSEREYGRVTFKTSKGEENSAKLMFLTGSVVEEAETPEPSEAEKKAERERLEELKKNKQAPAPASYSRRAQLVDVALRPSENMFFARALVNRLWARFLGRGLVDPVDQMHPENPPSHPELLEWLARDFVNHGYDMQRLIRGIISSRVYSRSSRWPLNDRPAPDLFAVAQVRPLSPRQYSVLLRLASTSPDRLIASDGGLPGDDQFEQLENQASSLAGQFDQPQDDFQIRISEALFISNSPQIQQELLANTSDTLVGKLTALSNDEELIHTAVWNIFSRTPDAEEVHLLSRVLTSGHPREIACRHLVWALLASSESRFNF